MKPTTNFIGRNSSNACYTRKSNYQIDRQLGIEGADQHGIEDQNHSRHLVLLQEDVEDPLLPAAAEEADLNHLLHHLLNLHHQEEMQTTTTRKEIISLRT